MSTRKIRNSWWVDCRCEGVRYRKRSPENSQAGAKAYELLLRQRLARGEPIDGRTEDQSPPEPSFREFSEKWYKTYVLTNNKYSTQTGKRSVLNVHLVPFFANMKLKEISSMHIEQFKAAKLEVGLAPLSINGQLLILGKCLRCAQEWGELEKVPKIKALKVPPQKFDFFSREESDRLLSAIADPMWYGMVLLAIRTGLRVGEIMGLEWSDVDIAAGKLAVRKSIVRGIVSSPKNNRERYLPLTPQLCNALSKIPRSNGLLFQTKNGNPLRYHRLRKTLARFCKRAGLRTIGWHRLRHTFASQLVGSGVSLKATQELLGHSDIRMTMRYAHLAPSALREAVLVLDQPVLEGVGQPVGNALPVAA
ncbi:MAG: site-specific integrase [Ignavibacteriae bacterium]|nr:site-specific integrase [Ignavibacteria bacterium]MBI3365277.1 site-specific integrase [Ignavibacteriota bacterium]